MAAISFDMSGLQPQDHTTIRWVIVHRDDSDFRFVSWCSRQVTEGTPEAEEEEVKAHKALDRAYGNSYKAVLLKQTVRVTRSIEEIPAMWEVQV